MATPEKPDLDYSYTAFQQAQGNNTFPGTQLDNDLAKLKQSIDDTIDFAGNVIRSDGGLHNGIVTKSSLAADVTLGVGSARPWATATAYAVDDTATTNNALYICVSAHTSGVFATDLSAGRWEQLAVWSPLTEVADNTISTAKLQNEAVTEGKLAPDSVTATKIPDASITAAKLAPSVPVLFVGASMDYDGITPPPGWVFKFGQALSRTTFSALMNVLVASFSGNMTSGSAVISGLTTDFRGLGLEGAVLEGAGVAPGATIASITATTVVMSANATAPGTSVLVRAFPHGNGDGSTTFNVPDDRDRVRVGRGNMGGTAAGLITTTGIGNIGFNTSRLNAKAGADRHQLSVAQLASHPHGNTRSISGGNTYLWIRYINTLAGGGLNSAIDDIRGGSNPGGGYSRVSPDPLLEGMTSNVTVNPAGGDEAHPNVQPSRATNSIIFTGVI